MLLTALTGLARTIPLGLGYRLADLATPLHRALCPARRRAVEGNLLALTGDPRLSRTLSFQVFRNYGRFLFEFLRGPDVPELPFRFHERERFDAAISRGRGVILPILHTGNWEIAGARLAREGFRVHAVAGVQLRPAWTEELRRRREAGGIRILPPSMASWRSIPRILARNGVLALPVDGNVFERGQRVAMAGHRVELPVGPARLAASSGAALLPAYSVRHADGTLSAEFLGEIRPTDRSPEALRDATAELAARFARVLTAHAGQWMIFRPFFEPRPRSGAGVPREVCA
jgi:KDO2-lipid IV(A) lauroyltransferase